MCFDKNAKVDVVHFLHRPAQWIVCIIKITRLFHCNYYYVCAVLNVCGEEMEMEV